MVADKDPIASGWLVVRWASSHPRLSRDRRLLKGSVRITTCSYWRVVDKKNDNVFQSKVKDWHIKSKRFTVCKKEETFVELVRPTDKDPPTTETGTTWNCQGNLKSTTYNFRLPKTKYTTKYIVYSKQSILLPKTKYTEHWVRVYRSRFFSMSPLRLHSGVSFSETFQNESKEIYRFLNPLQLSKRHSYTHTGTSLHSSVRLLFGSTFSIVVSLPNLCN